MKFISTLLLSITTTTPPLLTHSFTILPHGGGSGGNHHSLRSKNFDALVGPLYAKIGIFYSSSTGNTETVTEYIANAMTNQDQEVITQDIGDTTEQELMDQDSIIIGAPTWHTDADEKRSGTSWDDWLYDTLPELDFKDKNVAVFGLGDQESYSDYFCDAAGELYDLFVAKGAKLYGHTSTSGYTHHESKAERDGKFVGAMFDEDNQYDESEGRANAWVEQLKSEGFMEQKK